MNVPGSRHFRSLAGWPLMLLLLLCMGCQQQRPSRSEEQLSRTPPISSIRYSKSDAEQLVRAALTKANPTIIIKDIGISGYWTDYPGVKKGRPVYQCTVLAELVSGRIREIYTPVLLVDATTGKLLDLSYKALHPARARSAPVKP